MKDHMSEILESEAPPTDAMCSKCRVKRFKVRCQDCVGFRSLCVSCCRKVHHRHPYHRIKIWNETHFSPGWLWQTGVSIHLGHGGDRCPAYNYPDPDIDTVFPSPNLSCFPDAPGHPDPEESDEETDDMDQSSWGHSGAPPDAFFNGGVVIVIVHTNGVHHLPVVMCGCPDSPSEETLFLRMGLYPASYKNIKTVFTFQVLDDFLLANLECYTSGYHYYSKLRRMTNKVFPHTVPVCCSVLIL